MEHFVDIAQSVPVVFAARTFPDVGISSVVADNFAGSRRVIRRLVEQGHRRIGIINGPLFVSSGMDRWLGVRQALEESGADMNPSLVKEGDFTPTGGYQAAVALLKNAPRPTAIFAANHMMTVGCLKALREAELKYPEDISLAAFEGFDDTVFENLVWPPITGNDHPTKEMAFVAMDLLLDEIRGTRLERRGVSKDVILNTRLIITESTRQLSEAEVVGT